MSGPVEVTLPGTAWSALEAAPQNFTFYNPSLLAVSAAELLLVFRVSNIHFCGQRESWLDSVRSQTHIRRRDARGRRKA